MQEGHSIDSWSTFEKCLALVITEIFRHALTAMHCITDEAAHTGINTKGRHILNM